MNARPYQSVSSVQIEADIRDALESAKGFYETGNQYQYMHHAEKVRAMRRELTLRERRARK